MSPTQKHRLRVLLLTIGFLGLGLLPLVLLSGCATNTGDPSKDRRGRVANALLGNAARVLGRFAVASIQNSVQQSVGGHRVDWSASASKGLWEASTSIVSSDDLKRVLDAYAGPQAPVITSAIAPQLASITTPKQAQAVAVAAAAGLDRAVIATTSP